MLSEGLAFSSLCCNFTICLWLYLLGLICIFALVLGLCLKRVAISHNQLHGSGRTVRHTIGELFAWQHNRNHFLTLFHINHYISSLSKISLVLYNLNSTFAVWRLLWMACRFSSWKFFNFEGGFPEVSASFHPLTTILQLSYRIWSVLDHQLLFCRRSAGWEADHRWSFLLFLSCWICTFLIFDNDWIFIFNKVLVFHIKLYLYWRQLILFRTNNNILLTCYHL